MRIRYRTSAPLPTYQVIHRTSHPVSTRSLFPSLFFSDRAGHHGHSGFYALLQVLLPPARTPPFPAGILISPGSSILLRYYNWPKGHSGISSHWQMCTCCDSLCPFPLSRNRRMHRRSFPMHSPVRISSQSGGPYAHSISVYPFFSTDGASVSCYRGLFPSCQDAQKRSHHSPVRLQNDILRC